MANLKLHSLVSFTCILVYVVISCLAGRDYYKILGVSRDATEFEIKRSFRRLAMKMHPDKNSDNKDATKNFQDLREVFEVLSNPKKRKLYDEGGEERLKRVPNGGGGRHTYHRMDPIIRFYTTPYRESRQPPPPPPTLADRIFWRLIDNTVNLIHYVTARETFLTFVILTICALITSFILYKSPPICPPRQQPASPNYDYRGQSKQHHHEANNDNSSTNFDRQTPATAASTYAADELKIIELKAETYNGMIRLLKPGFRSIVLLTDRETKDKLLPAFKKAVWPYRRNKTLLFGYLCLDKNLDWYKCLLQEVTGISELSVNKRNCNGTVLSLNGFKKYFRVYHAKHHEIDYYDDATDNDGSFLGFDAASGMDDSLGGRGRGDDDDAGEDIESGCRASEEKKEECTKKDGAGGAPETAVDNLLDRLPIWLDKMFDGMTKRYFLDSWPEEIK